MTTRRVSPIDAAIFVPILVLAACGGEQNRKFSVENADCGRKCPVVFEAVATLGSPDDTIWPSISSSAVQGRDGRFYVGPTDHAGTLVIYSVAGRFLSTFGRGGAGPGEYSGWLSLARGPGDTISIIDPQQQRRTLIDAAGSPIRMHRVPPEYHEFAAVGTRVFVQADIRTGGLAGWPVHELGPDGSILHSFAQVIPYRHPELDGLRRISAAGDSGVWVAPANRYELTYYDTAGAPRKTIRPNVDFFPPDRLSSDVFVMHLWQDQGYLWVIIKVPDPDQPPMETQMELPFTFQNGIRRSDWLLEVLDIATGERVASLRFDEALFKGAGDELVYGMTENEAGGIVLRAYRARYRPSSRRTPVAVLHHRRPAGHDNTGPVA